MKHPMRPFFLRALCFGAALACACGEDPAPNVESGADIAPSPEELATTAGTASWPQWGQNPRHTGFLNVPGQPLKRNIVNVVYDPLVDEETASFGDLLVHYQVPLVDGDDVFMMFKKGHYAPNDWKTQTWGETRFTWRAGMLEKRWQYASDWRPPGNPTTLFFEPVFHPVLANGSLYVPGAGGTLVRLDRNTGVVEARIDPFSGPSAIAYTVSPLTADGAGNIYYNVIRTHAADFLSSDPVDSWLVGVTPQNRTRKVNYATLTPDAPRPEDACSQSFPNQDDPRFPLPWPPSREARPPVDRCSLQRVSLNVAPAIAPDGTIYSVTHPHASDLHGFLVAVNPDLTPKWTASLDRRFHDGCGVSVAEGGWLPPDGAPGGCRKGSRRGVDPTTNEAGSGLVDDSSSATPTVAPDGTILLGTLSNYNYGQGHLMQFSPSGKFLRAYGFGWDSTPAIWKHGGTYSIVLKENHYASGSYCEDEAYCPSDRTTSNPASPEAYFITQLSPTLEVEWQSKATNVKSCSRNAAGRVTCADNGMHPHGFEWCVNAPAVDANGVVYANSEDGFLYAVRQGGVLRDKIFQQLNLGAAYTPASLGGDGRVYSQNAGHLFVVGD
jgi:outer membrane protein assembly factor BamB